MGKFNDFLRKTAGVVPTLRLGTSLINWPVTIFRWVLHITCTVALFVALGCFIIDGMVFGLVMIDGWSSLRPEASISPDEFVNGIHNMYYAKLVCGVVVSLFACLIGWSSPKTAYKRTSGRLLAD